MKHWPVQHVSRVFAVLVPLSLLAGCPLVQYSPLNDLHGVYWVEYEKGELVFYELPRYRGDSDAMWYALATDQPGWFTGPGLYRTGADNTWLRAADQELTLDEVWQLHDPLPPPDQLTERSLGEQLSGLYWVEHDGARLGMYRFPRYRDEQGKWREFEADRPAWYIGPGLYEADEYFQWQRVPLAGDITLDEILQLYDLGPRPPGDPATGAHANG